MFEQDVMLVVWITSEIGVWVEEEKSAASDPLEITSSKTEFKIMIEGRCVDSLLRAKNDLNIRIFEQVQSINAAEVMELERETGMMESANEVEETVTPLALKMPPVMLSRVSGIAEKVVFVKDKLSRVRFEEEAMMEVINSLGSAESTEKERWVSERTPELSIIAEESSSSMFGVIKREVC